MKIIDEDETFYYYSGDDIRALLSTEVQVYNTEFKSNIKLNPVQLSIFFKEIKDN